MIKHVSQLKKALKLNPELRIHYDLNHNVTRAECGGVPVDWRAAILYRNRAKMSYLGSIMLADGQWHRFSRK